MQERKINYGYVVKVVALLLLLLGIIIFGVKVYHLTAEREIITRIFVLVSGILAYIYSAVFGAAGILIPVWTRKEANKVHKKTFCCLAIVSLSTAIILQLTFWGIILSRTVLIVIVTPILILNIYPVFYLLKGNMRNQQ